MYNNIRLPKNLKSIQDIGKFREYCLNPLGIIPKVPNHFKKEQVQEEYVNEQITIYRGEKPLNENTFAIKVDPRLSKPYIKQYLEKIYKLEIDRINTINYMGYIKRNSFNKNYRDKDWKKAYVVLKTPVPEFFQKVQFQK